MRTPLVGLLVVLLLPAVSFAQPDAAMAGSPRLARADVAFTVGWLNSDVSAFTSSEHNWTHAQATFGVHGGYYWTEHLKTEAIVERSTTATAWSYEQVQLPPGQWVFSGALHDIRYTRASVGQFYQFGHNAWVHVALGGGVSIVARRVFSRYQPLAYYDGSAQHLLAPPTPDGEATDTLVRPFMAAALKAYLTQRVFFRSDVQADFRATLDHLAIRAGFGVDF